MELLSNSKNGYLFDNNNKFELLRKFYEFHYDSAELRNKKKINAKKFFKRYSVISHYFQFNKILNINNG